MANNVRIEEQVDGVRFVALPKNPKKSYDTRLLKGAEGLKKLKAAMKLLTSKSPLSAKKLDVLKRSGTVTLVYLPGDAPKSAATGENVAVFLPKFIASPLPRGRSFQVIVGRHGVKWPTNELAAVLAHELVGHGMQHQRKRMGKMRPIDLECEAYLYEELANQDLGLNKRSSEMVRFRKGLETHWCADFKRYMRSKRNSELKLWDTLNPNVPRLLAIFEDYLRARPKKAKKKRN
ncbi:MAG: hypothetical protein OXT06_13935 [Rhodospirillaceae bacterium]|nr:hypothetical protein [Rhodospirillaceae bacterium]MDD9915515.1 hypothetical protein [Rhodospirillaceae bacterium]MDD9926916.1 hypothetical protein [Rhodospirillaceae bacterium]